METKSNALGTAMLVTEADLGFAAGIALSSHPSGNLAYELEIWDINWIHACMRAQMRACKE